MIIIVRTRDGQPVGVHPACCQAEAGRLLAQPGDGETWTALELTELPRAVQRVITDGHLV